MPMRCPSQIGAPRMRFYTGFLCLSSIQVQHDLTNGYLTHTSTAVLGATEAEEILVLTCADGINALRRHFSAQVEGNSSSALSPPI